MIDRSHSTKNAMKRNSCFKRIPTTHPPHRGLLPSRVRGWRRGYDSRRRGSDFAAQGGFSHSHLCRSRTTTWYPRPGVPQSVDDGTSLLSSSPSSAKAPPPSPQPPSPTSLSSSTRVLSVKQTTRLLMTSALSVAREVREERSPSAISVFIGRYRSHQDTDTL